MKVCDYQESAGCIQVSTTPGPDTTPDIETTTELCRNSNIYLTSHETDCTKFYAQISGKSYQLQCKKEMEFNYDAQVINLFFHVQDINILYFDD